MNTLTDLIGTLIFLGSLLIVIVLLPAEIVFALGRRWTRLGRLARFLGAYIAVYAIVLITVSLAMPRRVLNPGESKCFDDWCVAGVSAERVSTPLCPGETGGTYWVATLEVSSRARGVTQRASDVAAFLEDQSGLHYKPCAAPLSNPTGETHTLNDYLGPGESFTVRLPFRLPSGSQPTGLIISHGAFPGVLIIGDDQSGLHKHTLLKVALGNQ